MDEARYGVRRALSRNAKLGPESLPALLEEKRLLVNRSGVIEFIADSTSIGEVGGLEVLKTWLKERQKLFALAGHTERRDRTQGCSADGNPGLRKESGDQSDCLKLWPAALPRGHDRNFLGQARQARRRIRGSLPNDGRYVPGGSLVR